MKMISLRKLLMILGTGVGLGIFISYSLLSTLYTPTTWRSDSKAAIFQTLPAITLTMRMTSSKSLLYRLYCSNLRTATLYWSKYLGNIALILNEESTNDRKLAAHLSKYEKEMEMKFEFYYERPLNKTKLKVKSKHQIGYMQQLYSTFLMDLFIQTPVIAYTDTDAKFVSPVTPDNIFSGKKLKVKGIHSDFRGKFSLPWHTTAKVMLGFSIMADFMSYFPAYIWRDTITNCRDYIQNYTKSKTMEDVFSTTGEGISPISIIMSYAYYFEKDRYDWHIDIRNDTLENYNKLYVRKGHDLEEADLTPDLHLQIHDKHFGEPKNMKMANKLSYCSAVRHTGIEVTQKIREMCDPLRISPNWFMFQFEINPISRIEHITSWCKNRMDVCESLINSHYKKFKELVDLGIYDLDLKRVKVVEKVANEDNIYCSPYWHK